MWIKTTCMAALGLFFGVAAADSSANNIVKPLESGLRPSDLSLPYASLLAKLNKIGNKSDLFQVGTGQPNTSSDYRHLMRVNGAKDEIVVILDMSNQDDGDQEGMAEFWIGARNGRVIAQKLPPNSDDMIGPMHGVWRHQGRYLVGAGNDSVYHSPKWSDAEIQVYKETAKGITLVQRLPIDIPDSNDAVSFINHKTMDLVSKETPDSSARDGKDQGQMHRKVWRFRNGRYH